MPDHPEPPDRPVPAPQREAVQRWRLVVARAALGSDVGQREQVQAWERALTRTGLPVAGLDGDPPRPRHALAAPLSASVPGEAELADVWLTERVPAWRVREALGQSLPPGHVLVEAFDVWLGAPALPGQVAASVYRAELARDMVDPGALADACAGLLAERSLPRERRKGQGVVAYDLRPFLEGLAVDATAGTHRPDVDVPGGRGTLLRMTLRHDPERGIGRPDEVLAALGARLGLVLEPRSLVREGLVLATPKAVDPASRTGPRPGPRPAPRGARRSAGRPGAPAADRPPG